MLWLEVNFVGLYFRVELSSWTRYFCARETKSTSSHIAIQQMQNLLEYPQNGAFNFAIGLPCIMDVWEGHQELSCTIVKTKT